MFIFFPFLFIFLPSSRTFLVLPFLFDCIFPFLQTVLIVFLASAEFVRALAGLSDPVPIEVNERIRCPHWKRHFRLAFRSRAIFRVECGRF